MATTKITALEQELMSAAGVKAKKGEGRQAFLEKLVRGLNKLDDDALNAMSPEANEWLNAAIDAVEAKTDIDDFEPEVEVTETTPSKAAKGKAAAKAVTEQRPEAAPARKGKANGAAKAAPEAPKGPSAVMCVKLWLCEDPTLTKEELRAKLDKEEKASGVSHLSDASLQTARTDFLSVVKVLQEQGKLKSKMLTL